MMDQHGSEAGFSVSVDATAKYAGAIAIGAILVLIALRVLMERK